LGELLSVAAALQRLLPIFEPVTSETVPLNAAGGRVLAETVHARWPLPPFTTASMDGFAVRAADVQEASSEHPICLQIIGDLPAGQVYPGVLMAGQALRIMTGAALPAGADAVVPVEDTDSQFPQPALASPAQVKVYRSVHAGDYIRPRGQDLAAEQCVLARGQRLRPQDVGLLAMLGQANVPVYRRPHVAIFSTGDELISVGEGLSPGKIYDANTLMLAALLERAGVQVTTLASAPDDPAAIQQRLDQAVAAGVDLILSSAGVSVGAYDFVRRVIEAQGQLDFWRVNIRPGKPLVVGAYLDIPFIGLPGNPVSAFVCYEVFARPALARLAGLPDQPRPRWMVRLAEPVTSDGRESYLRAVVTRTGPHWLAKLAGGQDSGNLFSIVQANALLIVPSEVKSLPIGTEVEAWFLNDFTLC
jgi:molybdopterin molybdotransferase